MKILAFGNSHLASLKLAYDDGYKGGNQYEFIARVQGSDGLRGLSFVDGRPFHKERDQFRSWCTDDLASFDGTILNFVR